MSKKKGEKKNEPQFLVVHTMLSCSELHSWYLDSVCSYHMNRNKFLFTSFIEFDRENVTFGNGNMIRVKGKCTICTHNIHTIEEVLYVEGLKVNLISINQPVIISPISNFYKIFAMSLT